MSKIKLFANCIPVKGANRSVVCDLQRNLIKAIPNSLYEILSVYECYSIQQIKKKYENKHNDIIDEYIEFLLENEFIYLTDNPKNFPRLKLDWFEPFQITNAIIDFDKSSTYDLNNLIYEFEYLNCKHLELRLFDVFPTDIITNFLNQIKKSQSMLHSIIIVCNYKFKDIDFWAELMKNYTRIQNVILYNGNKNDHLNPFTDRNIIITERTINSKLHCGIVSLRHFAVNIKNFTESQQHNSCLNRKISIDVDGDIKNCPSMSQNFGNVKNTTLKKALEHKDFKKYWNITKDQIEVCKDCEFRYVCTDCRAYTENPINQYSKPLKCGYDPYSNKWEEWSNNPLKRKTIEYYNMKDLVKND